MPKKELQVIPEYSYVQDNRMVTAQYSRGLSLIGQKLIRIAISDIDPLRDKHFEIYTCSLSSLAKKLGIEHSKNIYRDVKRASAELMDTKLLIEDKRTGAYRRYSLFSYFDYEPGSGTVTIKFNTDMRKFLLDLQHHFTQVKLEEIIFMKHSKYSIRIFELIKMKLQNNLPAGKKTLTVDLSIAEIRQVTGTENTYKQIGQLRQYVLQPALQDIEEQANLHIELEDIRQGRKVVGVRCTIYTRLAWEYKTKTIK